MSSIPSNVVSILDPTLHAGQSIYEQSSDPLAKLGTRLRVGDRTFRYAQLSTSANELAGIVVCAPLHKSSEVSAVLTVSAATTGATIVSVTGSAIAVNAFAEGHLSIASSGLAGGGIMYRIKSHTAVASGTACALVLYDPIPGSVAAGPASISPNAYKDVKVDSEVLGRAVGVLPVAVTTGNYFWAQTWGPACPRSSAAIPAGATLQLGTAGGIQGITMDGASSGETIIGVNSNLITVATQNCPVHLTIEP